MTSLKKEFLIENYQIDGIARGNNRIPTRSDPSCHDHDDLKMPQVGRNRDLFCQCSLAVTVGLSIWGTRRVKRQNDYGQRT